MAICTATALLVGPGSQASATSPPRRHEAAPGRALSESSARRFLLTTVDEKVRGDWATAWTSLYPFHKRVASRDAYVRCESRTAFPAPLESMRVVDVRPADVHVPGRRRTVPGVAVRVIVALRWYGPRDPIVFRHTFHLVAVAGRWTWLLSQSRYLLYAHGACGSLGA